MLKIHLSRLMAVCVLSVVGVLGAISLVTGVGAVGDRPAALAIDLHNGIGGTAGPTPCSSPGSLDTSFGGDGKVTTPIGSEFDVGRSVAIQPDGRIVVAGNSYNGSNSDFAIVRYNVDGTLDTSFSGDGKAVTPFFASSDDIPFSVAIQSDGRIVVAGYTDNASNADIAVVRYNTNGTLDTSFDGDGKVITSIGSIFDIATSVSIQADGRIVVAGFSVTGSEPDFAVVRYNTNGSLDTSFDGDGKVITSIRGEDLGRSVAIQTDGRIVVAGNSFDGPDPDFAIVRYNTDGSLDTSFDGDGKVITPVGDGKSVAYSVVVQTDGRIVAAGCTNCIDEPDDNFAVVRYNTDGTLDTSFDEDGKVITSIGSNSDQAFSIAVQADGRLVAAGYSYDASNSNGDFAVVRYNTNGELDLSFDGDGKVTTSINGHDQALSVAIQAGGQIVAAGSALVEGGQADFAVVRYNGASCVASAPAPFDYDADGRTDFSVFRGTEGAWYLQRSTEGFVGVSFGTATDRIVPADYDGDGKTDVAVYRPSTGVWYVINSSDGTVTYYVFGIAEDLPTPADYDGDRKADISVFRPSSGTWYRINSGNGSFTAAQFGTDGDRPTVGDFDGDGKADIAVFRPSTGAWYQTYSSNGFLFGEQFGISTDKITPADYDGDGKTDIAIYRPSESLWYVKNSATSTYRPYVFGLAEDIPVPGDLDGDGKSDIAVFRPSDGIWYIVNSSNGSFTIYQFGSGGDRPTPAAFL